MKVTLVCHEVVKDKVTVQKERKQDFDFKVAEKILRKGNWKLPENSNHVFKDGAIIAKAKKTAKKEQASS